MTSRAPLRAEDHPGWSAHELRENLPPTYSPLSVGELVTWMHKPRGGYGYTIPVAAKVLAISGDWLTVEVVRNDDTLIKRRIKRDSIRRRP